jgi:hypothetical protein
MDGTLLNSKDVISKENEAALKELQQRGVKVTIASGRVDLMLKPFIKQLDLNGYVIACNGGLIRDLGTGEILYSKIMDKVAARNIISYCSDNNIDFLIYTADRVYSSKNNLKGKKYEDLNKILSKDLQLPLEYVDDRIIERIDDINALKILLVSNDHDQVKLLEKHFSRYDTLTAVSSMKGHLDIMGSNISKGRGLKILSEKLNIDMSEIIAFGDNYNDIDMFQSVGMPIAMENAVEDIKLRAKYITKSNDESGIAFAINNYILCE